MLDTIPPNLGYTAWIGLAAKTEETGGQYYTWESGEVVSYTNWDNQEPGEEHFWFKFRESHSWRCYFQPEICFVSNQSNERSGGFESNTNTSVQKHHWLVKAMDRFSAKASLTCKGNVSSLTCKGNVPSVYGHMLLKRTYGVAIVENTKCRTASRMKKQNLSSVQVSTTIFTMMCFLLKHSTQYWCCAIKNFCWSSPPATHECFHFNNSPASPSVNHLLLTAAKPESAFEHDIVIWTRPIILVMAKKCSQSDSDLLPVCASKK